MKKANLALVAQNSSSDSMAGKSKKAGSDGGPGKPHIIYEMVGRQKLRVAIWKGAGDKRPILFFNGIGANLELASPLHEALPDRDVITFDMPGIGKSPSPKIPYRPWWISHVAAKILDRHGYTGKIDVIGVSWGGAAAQQFAFQCQHRVNRVVLAATSSGMTMVPGDFGVISKMATPQRYLDPEYLKKNFERLYGEGEDMADTHMIRLLPPTLTGYFGQMLAMLGWTSLPFLPLMRKPTLVMMGDRDRIVPLINGKILKAFLPKGRLHVVEGGGHLFIISRLKEIAPVLRSFLDEDAIESERAKAKKAKG
jgi:poly(3-hydroxyalkanoate) depolymerase